MPSVLLRPWTARSTRVRIQSRDGTWLQAYVTRTEASLRSKGAVIFAHGLGSHGSGEKAMALERVLLRKGYDFVRFDFRGHGNSEGSVRETTLSRMIDDVEAVYEASTRELQLSDCPVLVGSSLGAMATAWYQALRLPKVAATALIAPALGLPNALLKRMDPHTLKTLERDGSITIPGLGFRFDLTMEAVDDARKYPESTLAERLAPHTLIVHGTEDQRVPWMKAREFSRCCLNQPKTMWIDGGNHHLDQYREKLGVWIDRFASQAQGDPAPSP